ncbi:non-ribosomal peptide synthetase [Streptantibioticus ferralitis]|uniref:Phenyloxazoline synthase MbtB n=1 Tax=Streptantibioticus ferralitis TaxID=236510 RepID=A0ABT5Z0U6_9ACTN|nr:non-ribosomal peptide synthetase [Streptantibioticus ferralitis]MDF2257471.1 amino acid adenylation domain-containing protein [Streptantibioticus ferralitis]
MAAADLADEVAELLGLPTQEVGEDQNLIALGLDSLAMMRLAGRLRRSGLDIGFAELAAEPTVAAWRELVAAASQAGGTSDLVPTGALRVDESEPFELALMQHAYWVGRAEGQQLGGVAAHFYNEFDGEQVDPVRLESAVRALLARHGMLRVRILDDGRQQIAARSNWPGLRVHDLRTLPAADAERELADIRQRLSHRRMDIAAGDVFDIQLSLLPPGIRPGGSRVHVNLDMVAADALSLRVLLADLARGYADPGTPLPALDYSFPRYLAERRAARNAQPRAAALDADRDYWRRHLPDLPAAPQLPLVAASDTAVAVRRHRWLDPETMRCLDRLSRRHGLTLAMALAAIFAETLTAFSAQPRFLLNLPLFDREPLHAEVNDLVGDFTSSVLLAWDGAAPGSFAERAARLQARFHADAAHAGYSGVEVLRDASRLHGEQILAPVVYTSALGLGELFPAEVRDAFGEPSWIISQGPQVWLDAQVTEVNGGLLVNWDVREDAFAPGVPDAMFDAYSRLLDRLLSDQDAWSEPAPALLPEAQLAVRAGVNDTAAPIPGTRLHDGFFAYATRDPQATALRWGRDRSLSYGELAGRALALAAHLRSQGVGPGDLVTVTLPKGPEQITAVLGVLAAGAAYLPLGADQPELRRERIHRTAGVRLVLDDLAVPEDVTPLVGPVPGAPADLAYVIYTSGSTGEPKGVEITHAAAMNTVDDINERFAIGPEDRTLALSALDFDLSVFDVFGPLSVGGAVVLIEEEARRDAGRWLELVRCHGVTVWNTVPALLEMLLIVAEGGEPPEPLRLVLVSGDWVGLDLPGRLAVLRPGCRFIALGGATEAAIWSNAFEVAEVDPGWRSVPYGCPLRNQRYRVVDALGRDCPNWVTGELWIGGAGVARGYRGAPELTADRFVEAGGERWYRTGDLGRYWPDGTLEFLGRADRQVKVRGHRIELGEVEAALRDFPGVGQGIAVVCEDGGLAAAVTDASPEPVPDWKALADIAAGASRNQDSKAPDITELRAFLAERLPSAMVPERIALLSELPLTPNGKVDRAALRRTLGHHDAQGAVPVTRPTGQIERRAAAAWSEILGVAEVGREHDFFALGGDSLLATRLVGRLRADGFADVTLAQLFRRPVLADFAATLRLDDTTPSRTVLAADPEHRLEPFPLTDVQRAYWLGRGEGFTLGGVGCHFYREYDVLDLDVERLEAAVDRLVRRHEMLRAVVDERGRQRILPDVPRYRVTVTEAGSEPEAAFEELRNAASHQVFDPASWPLFSIRAVRYGNRIRLGIGVDNIVLDALSILTFYAELGVLYEDLDAELPPVGVSFRDYVLGAAREPAALAVAREYWNERLPDLPPSPQLPLAVDPATVHRPRFTRREARISAAHWRPITDRAREHGLTPSAVLLAAFAEVLGRWSARADLTLNLTLFDRKDVHPDIANVLGDFTSLMLVACRPQSGESWLAKARRVQQELWEALDRREVSAVWVLRELARHTGEPETTMPVVFTSALGVGSEPGSGLFTDYVWGVSQTPQVWLDHQVTDAADGGVHLNWDVVEELFPDGLVDVMFDAYLRLLDWLGWGDWDSAGPDLLPGPQQDTRAGVNATGTTAPAQLLHAGFFQRAAEHPDRVALRWGDQERLSYGQLAQRALRLATLLAEHGVQRGEVVAVTLPKGPDQIAAVLGVLAAGAAYLPVGPDQPAARRDRIHRLADVHFVVTDEAGQAASGWTESLRPLVIDDFVSVEPAPRPVDSDPDALAYVIFTSGSTGEPKGVEITHAAAMNTVDDINTRFAIGSEDRTLALSALDFDLSVFDVFGPLSVGGAVVLVEEESRRDARRWLELVRCHGVTVWNSVPALLDMLLVVAEGEQAPDPLRMVLVSGDWVGLDLPGRLAAQRSDCRFVALGGATEAAIWSNAFEVAEVEPGWRSIPYGFPLRNQRYRVVDTLGRDCPDWVTGELWIGGAGVARGYRGAPDATAQRFVELGGERWYRTGDLGRYWPDGTLEFLGRADRQVKVRGHRIELGEIEAALRDHPGVGGAVVTVAGEAAARQLLAAVVPATPSQSIDAEGTEPSADLLAERARALQQEGEAVEAVLIRLLRLDELADREPYDFATRLSVADEHLPTLRLWLRWLVEQKVLVEEAGAYGAGPGLASALTRTEPQVGTDEYGGLIARVHARLLERLDDYRQILAGRLDPAVLLDDDALSPVSLADQDPGTAQVIAEIARRLADLAEKAGRPIEVAELGGRDGRTAARLLGLLGPEQVRYTLLDPAPTMVAEASRRLEALPHQTACHQLRRISDDLRHRFDAVVAVNALHRYPDPAQGLALAALLARSGGTLIAAERAELTPIVLLTGALLDRGYSGFDRERQKAGSPMLPGSRWAELLSRAGLSDAGYRPMGSPGTELLWARRPETAVDLDPVGLRAHVATRLPAHMVPERVEVLPWLPLSANGKVDRAALAALAAADGSEDLDEAPQGGLEQEIAVMWAELLGRSTVGRRRSFFELGGDSLLATRFIERVKQRYGVELPLRRLFAGPSLAQVTAALAEELAAADEMEEGAL